MSLLAVCEAVSIETGFSIHNPGFLPDTLALTVSLREQGLTRSALLSEHFRFGFTDARTAETCLNEFLLVSNAKFEEAARLLSPAWQYEMHARLQQRIQQWQAEKESKVFSDIYESNWLT